MNIVKNVEARLVENKYSIKTYKSHQMACGRADNIVKQLKDQGEFEMEYLLVYLPSLERFTVVFNLTSWLRRNEVGGYVGFLNDEGFYTI